MSLSNSHRQGFSLPEVLLVMTITALILAITYAALRTVVATWWTVNANQGAEHQLYRGQSALHRDLEVAAFELQPGRATLATAKKPSQLVNLSGSDGDVFWMLSAIDPASGLLQRKADGSPFWQRNIVYYAVCPEPASLTEMGFQGPGLDVDGYESACPYKILIRKEIDSGVPTVAGGAESTEETLLSLTDISGYLERPVGYSCAAMNRPGVVAQPISARVLTFRVDLLAATRGVSVDLRCTALERADKEGLVGARDLSENPVTSVSQFMAFPPNLQTVAP